VRGFLVQARFEFLRRGPGPGAIEAVLAALPPEERGLLRGVEAWRWYPFEALIQLDKAIATVLGRDEAELFEDLGRLSARMRTEWMGSAAPLVSVHGFLARVEEDHRLFNSFGRVTYRRLGFTEGEISSSDFPAMHRAWCSSARGFLRGAVERLTGGTVTVDERTCQTWGDAACVFRVRWTGRDETPSL
jgi:predicted hydrocarbon binding protein